MYIYIYIYILHILHIMHYISYVIYYVSYIDAINNRMMHPKAYRAPELLLIGVMNGPCFVPPSEPVLTSGIDVWAMGCFFVEMSTGVSPFDEFDTGGYVEIIREIVGRLGSPTTGQLMQWGSGIHKIHVVKEVFTKKCVPWEIIGVHQELKSTLSQMIVYDLDHRISSLAVSTYLVSG